MSGSNKDTQVILTIRYDLFYEPGTDDIAAVDETEHPSLGSHWRRQIINN